MNLPHSELAAQWITLLAAGMLVIQLLMVVQRMLLTNIRLFALQSLMLAAIAAIIAYFHNATHVYWVAGLTLVGKVFFLPWLLNRQVRRIQIEQEIAPLLNSSASMLLCGGLTLLGYIVARPFTSLERLGNNTLGVAITLLLTGFFLMFNRRKAITQVLALLTVENGVMLAAVALTTYGMPLVVELGIFFDVLVAVMVLGLLVYRIRETLRLDGCQQAEPVERMTLLSPILIVPAAAGLLCLLLRSRRAMAAGERARLRLHARARAWICCTPVTLPPHVVTEWGEFFRADALSAWMVLLISVVSLGSSLYAGRYFRARPGGRGGDAGPGEGVLCAHAAVQRRHVPGGAGQQSGRDVVRRWKPPRCRPCCWWRSTTATPPSKRPGNM